MDTEAKRTALLLGTSGFGVGAVQTALKSHGYSYQRKVLTSSPRNWQTMVDLLSESDSGIGLVVAKLTEYPIFLLTLPAYARVRADLISRICTRPHQVFIYNENLFGNFTCMQPSEPRQSKPEEPVDETFIAHLDDIDALLYDTDRKEDLRDPRAQEERRRQMDAVKREQEKHYAWLSLPPIHRWCERLCPDITPTDALSRMEDVIGELAQTGLNIVPYRTLVDIDLAAQVFIEHDVQGLVLRMYVPAGRLWSRELDKMITLFREYVANVTGHSVQLTQNRTGSGVTFSLYSPNIELPHDELRAMFDHFADFLALCVSDPKQAEEFLLSSQIPQAQAREIVTRYATESRRLLLDLKQERETRLLAIKHSLEAEILEAEARATIGSLATAILPMPEGLGSVIAPTTQSHSTPPVHHSVYINPQFIEKVEGVVAQNMHGNISYSVNDEMLRRLFQENADSRAEVAALRSALDELHDHEVPYQERVGAWQKLEGFLAKIGGKLGNVGLEILKTYLEGLIKSGG